MKRFVVLAVALGAVLAMAGAARAQAANPPAGSAPTSVGRNFADADGDGLCDRCTGTPRGHGRGQGQKARRGRGGYGPGDGTGNRGVGPRDGSGYGPGAGSGSCNRTGPRGRGRRGGRG
jgi:hypothetical protein